MVQRACRARMSSRTDFPPSPSGDPSMASQRAKEFRLPSVASRRACATVNSHRYVASTRGETLREKVLRNLASRAATDAGFLKQARRDLEGTLAMFDYDLTHEELRLVEDLRHRTAGMSDEQLARTLASGLRGRTGTPPARPAAPSWRGSDPRKPACPGD